MVIDLRRAGVLTLDGEAHEVEAVLLAMSWDLAVALWAVQIRITLIGTGKVIGRAPAGPAPVRSIGQLLAKG
ncbi:hypothetical protein [Amycolatopsis sp. SID8362]|uniref:hypothetical protein n=1 Tax=Amycolatopsis sp. SID8362 TaxID=2690346 RepID=UPI001369DDD0|nr:hypothetical protein [Amycolatopsis sp. SID8362]NBH07735.1 hypothetical protein [Amycolatopsis sp. SID8362]NED44430.1 hypothetical protein [Amycolatopsis sp. SID8362]